MKSYMLRVIEDKGITNEWVSRSHLLKILKDRGLTHLQARLNVESACLHEEIETKIDHFVTYYRVTGQSKDFEQEQP